MKKAFCAISIVLSFFYVCCPTFSFSGWNFVDGQYVYLNPDGRKLQNAWMKSEDSTYYLDENGFITKNALIEYDDELYYLDLDGKKTINMFMFINESVKVPEGTRYGFYYFDEKGRAVRKTNNSNFKRFIDGHYYAFAEDGLLAEGWFDKDGECITDPELYLTEGVYYSDENGCLYYNNWYEFTYDVGSTAFSDIESNIMSSSYDEMKSMWMYFDNSCKKTMSNDNKPKIKNINGRKYAFDENGVMVEGFIKNGELSVLQPSNPSLKETVKLYSFENGEGYKNEWVKVVSSKHLSNEDYCDETYSWYYVDDSNNIISNKLKNINNHKYIFDGIGKMRTGFCLNDRNGLFVASYKPEELTRDDFVYSIDEGSKLNGSEMSDLRFFELGDDNGQMLTGNIKIELEDGEYEFLFSRDSGVAKGNKHTLKKSKDVYYINGLKLTPLEDMKYGVVKVEEDKYVVVNKNGKLVKGKKKLIKDDYENILVIMNDTLVAYIDDVQGKIKLKWQNKGVPSISDASGYYYYNGETEVKDYTALAVASGTSCPTPAQIEKIPEEMRLNFK